MTNSLMNGLGAAMHHLGQRQRVVAQNIANADTAGYKARDVENPDFSAMVDTGGPHVARPRVQLSGAMKNLGASDLGGSHVVLDRDTVETKPDGNNVTLEEQVMKLGTIQADFNALTNIYKKQMQLMKIATRGN